VQYTATCSTDTSTHKHAVQSTAACRKRVKFRRPCGYLAECRLYMESAGRAARVVFATICRCVCCEKNPCSPCSCRAQLPSLMCPASTSAPCGPHALLLKYSKFCCADWHELHLLQHTIPLLIIYDAVSGVLAASLLLRC
jgi:hypothetical protein